MLLIACFGEGACRLCKDGCFSEQSPKNVTFSSHLTKLKFLSVMSRSFSWLLRLQFVVMNLFNLAGAPNLSPPFTPSSMSATAKVRQILYVMCACACVLYHTALCCCLPCSLCNSMQLLIVQTASGMLIRCFGIVILAGVIFS